MILTELVLHNFGVYGNRQVLDLSPRQGRPIVLIGGLNGGGKTTLLDALQLSLYGPRARLSNRGALAYDEYLKEAIHRGKHKAEGAAVELAFRHWSEGHEETFRVHRSWKVVGDRVRERLEVSRNGKLDPVLTESWADYVESFIPIGISHLFLFDGEKIEQLADKESAATVLSTAVQSLLGLDLVEQLKTDLIVLERRKRSEAATDVSKTALQELDTALHENENVITLLVEQQAPLRNSIGQLRKGMLEAEENFRRGGGDAFEKRGALEAEREDLAGRLEAEDEALREIAAGAAPLMLCRVMLEELAAADLAERDAANTRATLAVLANRDEQILEHLRHVGASGKVSETLAAFLAQDRAAREKTTLQPHVFDLSDMASHQLHGLLAGGLKEIQGQISRGVTQAERLQSRVDDIDRRLDAVPDEDALQVLIAARATARQALDRAEAKLSLLEEQHTEQKRVREQLAAKRSRLDEALSEAAFESEAAARVVEHSERVRATLVRFREALVKKSAKRIESLVLESLQRLMRKDAFVSAVHIDPVTFAVEVSGPDGTIRESHRLSAGERQLLAVSLLWALARASGRPLPAVIDTPLGRLDSIHRRHLVERYFPHASHQVLLLSTDEEVDEEFYGSIREHIGHEYVLEYDAKTSSTLARPGYFWERS
jgi:DNA sulfur modification protein DndD